jgi:hypothetical protein
MQRLFGLERGKTGDYISDYEGSTGPAVGMETYYGNKGVDLEKSAKLKKYRQKYGPALDNAIIGENMRLFAGSTHGMYNSPTGTNMFTDAQENVLRKLEAQELIARNTAEVEERREEEKQRVQKLSMRMREAKLRSGNPMMFGG